LQRDEQEELHLLIMSDDQHSEFDSQQSSFNSGEPELKHAIYLRPSSRPFLVTLLVLVVLTITAIHLVRFFMALSWWGFLSGLPGVSPLYLAVTGLSWSVIGLPLAWGLWQGLPWVPKALRFLAPAYCLYHWLEQILLARSTGEMTNWPFAAGVTIIVLLTVFWMFSWQRVRGYFGERHEQSRKD
jgi:hypothetical protein